jgi:hypothetical protein
MRVFPRYVGIASPEGESASELLSRSDVALYTAKTSGRNMVMLAPLTAIRASPGQGWSQGESGA